MIEKFALEIMSLEVGSKRRRLYIFACSVKLGNRDKQMTAITFGRSDSTLRTWMNGKRFH
jgi:hypothetical protein